MIRKMKNGESGVILMETLLVLPVYAVILAGIFWLGELCLIRQILNTAERLRFWENGYRYISSTTAAENIFTAFCETPNTMQTATRQNVVTGVSGLATEHTDAAGNNAAGFSSSDTDNGWGTVKKGFVQLNTRRSEWSYGIIDFCISGLWSGWGTNANARQIASGRDIISMTARTDNTSSPLSSSILFRKEIYKPDKDVNPGKRAKDLSISVDNDNKYSYSSSFNNNTDWNVIYGEKWIFLPDFFPSQSVSETTTEKDENDAEHEVTKTYYAGNLAAYGKRNSDYVDWSE